MFVLARAADTSRTKRQPALHAGEGQTRKTGRAHTPGGRQHRATGVQSDAKRRHIALTVR
eukprot:921265-Alexandrium_andersonii.AAC.1